MTPRAEQVLPPGYRRLILIDGPTAAHWTGRPESTLRRWAHEHRVTRHGTPHRILYNLDELPERTLGGVPTRKATP